MRVLDVPRRPLAVGVVAPAPPVLLEDLDAVADVLVGTLRPEDAAEFAHQYLGPGVLGLEVDPGLERHAHLLLVPVDAVDVAGIAPAHLRRRPDRGVRDRVRRVEVRRVDHLLAFVPVPARLDHERRLRVNLADGRHHLEADAPPRLRRGGGLVEDVVGVGRRMVLQPRRDLLPRLDELSRVVVGRDHVGGVLRGDARRARMEVDDDLDSATRAAVHHVNAPVELVGKRGEVRRDAFRPPQLLALELQPHDVRAPSGQVVKRRIAQVSAAHHAPERLRIVARGEFAAADLLRRLVDGRDDLLVRNLLRAIDAHRVD